ncbi:hypothetical protein [Pseudomonas reinekei]|uniref:Uncharacterized protein n=2 Tax=Pseudomonas reinekei TaxID=395598 RepID=A0A1Q9WNF8_PSERE|nr:hypothetical protein [Pseudomonas reinekei]OLU00329.1 hypothetical protein BVK86_22060 [Pseudomonas reinekei]
MTACVTDVHKWLMDGYIDALFRRILSSDLGINRAKAAIQASCYPLDGHDHRSEYRAFEWLFRGAQPAENDLLQVHKQPLIILFR